jgi:hypothetical protein
MPTTMTIYPYLLAGDCWVFDDERTGLKEEAFVMGMTEMISEVVKAKAVPNAAKGFALRFSEEPFDHDVELVLAFQCRMGDDRPGDGRWYQGMVAGKEMVGWLCPALFCYFDQAPPRIFVKAEPLPAGVDPIWHVRADDPKARRFVSAPSQ